jgi:hypothetical protein
MDAKNARPADRDISGRRRGEEHEFVSPTSILIGNGRGVKHVRSLAEILAHSLNVCKRNGWTRLYKDLRKLADRERARGAR